MSEQQVEFFKFINGIVCEMLRDGQDMDKKRLVKRYVNGLDEHGLLYHFDDCATDCLDEAIRNGFLTIADTNLINAITGALYCEEMFEVAYNLVNTEDPQLKAMEQLLEVVAEKDKKEVQDAIDARKIELGINVSCVNCGDAKPHQNCAALMSSGSDDESRFCTCNVRELMTYGCKCGGC